MDEVEEALKLIDGGGRAEQLESSILSTSSRMLGSRKAQ
jgi:hypothetical protein